jgi:predicted MFS family arabinose efflux permease
MIAAANLAAAGTHSFIPFVIARSVSGLAVGVLSAVASPLAACRPDGQRVLTYSTAAAMISVSGIYLGSPTLIERHGAPVVFLIIAAIALLAVAAISRDFPKARAHSLSDPHSSSSLLAPGMACAASAIVTLGQGSVFIFIIAIGQALGLTAGTVSRSLATALPLSLVAALVARAVGERLGLIKPIMIALLLLAADILLLGGAKVFIRFYLCVVGLNLFFVFSTIYFTALIGRLDPSGRCVNILTFLCMVVAAFGPALGSRILVSGGYRALTLTGATAVTVGACLFLVLAVLTRTHFFARSPVQIT